MITQILALVILLLLSALFSSTETAFTSLSIMQIQEIESKRGAKGKLVKSLTSRPDILLTTILIGNNLVNIAASALATQFTIQVFGNRAVGLVTGILTLVVLIFAEVTPKRLAIIYNEFISVHSVRLIIVLSWILRPVILFIGLISNGIARLFKGKEKLKISFEGILHMINLGEHLGILKRYETRMVRGIFRFDDITVQAVMTHRTEVFSLEMGNTIAECIDDIASRGFSRIPVYDKEPENITGILLVRDLMKYTARGEIDIQLKDIMVEPIFIPLTKTIHEMFTRFKREKLNMAVVMDEYGGIAGIVSLEDVIEEILGELYDEHESQSDQKINKIAENQYTVAADISLHQFNESLDVKLPSEKYAKTLGGYIINRIDHIPREGEIIETEAGRFIIEKIEKNRLLSVLFQQNKQQD